MEVHPDYKQFASNDDNSVYTITNDPKLFGLDVVLLAFESHLVQAVTKTQGKPNSGRCDAYCLDSIGSKQQGNRSRNFVW